MICSIQSFETVNAFRQNKYSTTRIKFVSFYFLMDLKPSFSSPKNKN